MFYMLDGGSTAHVAGRLHFRAIAEHMESFCRFFGSEKAGRKYIALYGVNFGVLGIARILRPHSRRVGRSLVMLRCIWQSRSHLVLTMLVLEDRKTVIQSNISFFGERSRILMTSSSLCFGKAE